jgi:hypothetical protein
LRGSPQCHYDVVVPLRRVVWVLLAATSFLAAGPSPAFAARSKADKQPKQPPPDAAPASTEPKAPERRRIAVLELGGLGIASDMMRNLEMLLRNSIATMEGVTVVSPVDVQIALRNPKYKDIANCGGGPACAVEIAKLVSADVVVFGTIGAIGQNFALNVRAMDVNTGKELARQQTSISGNRDLLIPELRLAAFRLIAPDRIRGSLLIEIDVEGVEVEIDGHKIGTTPIKDPVGNLTPGEHVVVLRRPGYSQFQQEFSIRPFETARLRLDLQKANPK